MLSPGETLATAALLHVPGVIVDSELDPQSRELEWHAISAAIVQALKKPQHDAREGQAMAKDIRANCQSIAAVREIAAVRLRLSTRMPRG